MEETGKKLAAGITRREDGTIAVRVTCQVEGKRRSSRSVLREGTTLAEAIEVRERLKRELTGVEGDKAPIITLSDYATRWLAAKAERLRPRVTATYTTILAHHILPQLGEMELAQIKRAHVEAWVKQAEKSQRPTGGGYSRPTLTGWWRLLVQLLRDAAADHDLRDPTERVQAPRIDTAPKRELRTLTSAQLDKLLQAAADYTPDRHGEIVVLASTGLRAGELYGLRWMDVDETAKCLHVRHSASKGHITAPKGGASRVVCAPSAVFDVLRVQRTALLNAHRPALGEGLVFPSAAGTSRDANSLIKPLALISVSAELPLRVTPQVLRRTYNTLMIAAGADPIVLRAQMGHSSPAMTARYAGIGEELKLEMVQLVFR